MNNQQILSSRDIKSKLTEDRVLASVSEIKRPLQSYLPASDPNLPNLQHKFTLYPRIPGFMSQSVCMKC